MKTAEELAAEAAAAAEAEKQKKAKAAQEAGKLEDDDDENMSPEDMKKLVAKLRKENASRRTATKSQEDLNATLTEKLNKITKHLGLEDDKADPEEKIKGLQSKNAELELDLAITQMARAHNVPVEHDDYFRYLVQKRVAEFEKTAKDGEEFPEELFKEVAEEVSQYGGQGQQRKSLGASNGGQKKPASQNNGDLTAEKFADLSLSDKVALKQKDPETYKRLWSEAVSKRLIK